MRRNGKSAGGGGTEDQAGEFDGVVNRRDDLRGALDRLAAKADRGGEGCGDAKRAFETVVGVGNARGALGRWFWL
jgi:hypothetical protein